MSAFWVDFRLIRFVPTPDVVWLDKDLRLINSGSSYLYKDRCSPTDIVGWGIAVTRLAHSQSETST